jgi:hypothetical protein
VGGCRRLRNEEFLNLYASRDTIMVMKLRRIRRAVHVTQMGIRNVYKFSVGKPEWKTKA